ncbi:MAG: tetratricopeptide repeat protein [Bacteroidota bacterium]
MASQKKIIPKGKKAIIREEKLLNWKLPILISVSFVAYYHTLGHDFVNWDDIAYIMNNDMITAYNWVNLKHIFSSYFMGNYNPMILLSFQFDFHFFNFSAHGYHLHNLLLHLVNATLVYAFFFYLLRKNSNVAITIALLFSLHPMHVESVAWISERKDVLYTAYYFLSLIAYIFYIREKKITRYLLAVAFFIISCMSKAQAVTLPVVLILVDYFLQRRFDRKNILEKIPFFAIALFFGIVAIFAQKANHFINPMGIPVSRSIFYAPYSLCVYLFKFLLPVNQIVVYDYPLTETGTLPWYLYFSPIIFLAVCAVIWKTWKTKRYITFGILFFLATILPVLQFLPVGPEVVAERYTYIPYIGLSFILAFAFWEYCPKFNAKTKTILDGTAILLLVFISFLAFNRTLVWRDSIALWTDVMDKNPGHIAAYSNRAFMYNENKEYEKAIQDLTEGIRRDPGDTKFLNFYTSRAFLYKKLEKYDLALADYSKALEIRPDSVKPYLDRGILYTDRFRKYDLGIHDFRKFLKKYPEDINCNFNLGIAYYKKTDFDSAKIYFNKSIELNPANGDAHNLLASIFYKTKDYPAAYKHGILAKQCGASVDSSLMNFLIKRKENNFK